MLNILNIREIIMAGCDITVHNDKGAVKYSTADEVINVLENNDTCEIVMNIREAYMGGAIITHNQGELDVMCIHEGTDGILKRILDTQYILKPLKWRTTLRDGYAYTSNNMFDYLIMTRESVITTYDVEKHHTMTGGLHSVERGFKSLDHAKQWVEVVDHKKLMKEFVYGL